ncbi:MAG: lipid-A-disaccharide synthase, partial [Syntrophothermus sp.]
KFFRQSGVDCEYVGHPLLEQIAGYSYLNREDFFEKYSLDKSKKILLVLPGSRKQEVSRIFPETIKGAIRLADEFGMQVVVACSSDINEKVFYSLTDRTGFKIIKDRTYDLYRHSEFGIIKSGTSTLEAALFGLPMVVVYATNRITYLIGRTLIKIDTIGLVNIVAGKKIIRELIQDEVNEENIFQVCGNILKSREETENIKQNLKEIRTMLGTPGASARCALIISSFLQEQGSEKLREKNNI